ncbi:MAG: hypothetical protein BGO69_16140 [Bacteroidetes bacterium 46-16]|nr:MAG: hypothetical protein BGO69_16140 [Bacteroidetes bacterium 46-16]
MRQAIDKEIQQFLPLLGNEEKESILAVIRSFLNLKKENSARISVEQYNREVNESINEYKKGNYISQEDLENEAGEW